MKVILYYNDSDLYRMKEEGEDIDHIAECVTMELMSELGRPVFESVKEFFKEE